MQHPTTIALLSALSTLAVAGAAAADNYEISKPVARHAEAIWYFHEKPHLGIKGDVAQCKADLAIVEQAGLAADAKMDSYTYKYLPGAVLTDRGSPPSYEITWANARAVCAVLENVQRLGTVTKVLGDTRSLIGTPDDPYLKTGSPATAVTYDTQGKACLAAVDAAYAAGAKPADPIVLHDKQLTLGAARTEICQALVDWAVQYPILIEQAQRADLEARLTPWRAAGVTGERLALFAEAGADFDGWYVKGCKEATSHKQLKTAKAVFQWFYPPDGGHLIRKYTFKGDKIASTTERTFVTEERAYAVGCK